MLYEVVYKKWSDIQQKFAIVQADIEAETFTVTNGDLVLFDSRNYPFMAVPSGSWSNIEPTAKLQPTLFQ